MTIGVVSVAYGEKYRAFVPRWMRAITALETKPDKVLIITDDVRDCIDQLGDVHLDSVVFKQAHRTFTRHPQYLVNEAIQDVRTDWICKMDIDDLIYPHALNNLDRCDADVYMFGISYMGQWLPARPVNAYTILTTMHNLVFSCSPFRRWVWEKSPYKDILCEDWAFWVDAARNNAKFQPSSTIDYEYVQHGDNISLDADFVAYERLVRDSYDRRGNGR
jgi:hypothetical protein